MKVSPKGLEVWRSRKGKKKIFSWRIELRLSREWIHVFVSVFHSAICFYGDWWLSLTLKEIWNGVNFSGSGFFFVTQVNTYHAWETCQVT